MTYPRTLEVRWSENPVWEPIRPRMWRMRTPLLRVQWKTTEGVECFNYQEGVITDFRSGGIGVDLLVPQVRNTIEALDWLRHDTNYTGFGPSRLISDQWLYDDLIAAGYSKLRAGIVYRGVRIGGAGHYSEEPTKEFVEREYWPNLDKIKHTVLDKFTLDVTCPHLRYPCFT